MDFGLRHNAHESEIPMSEARLDDWHQGAPGPIGVRQAGHAGPLGDATGLGAGELPGAGLFDALEPHSANQLQLQSNENRWQQVFETMTNIAHHNHDNAENTLRNMK